jgi:hypothetical protein
MPMWLWAFGQIAWSFICSRVGNIAVAALVAFLWGQHRADVACRAEAEATQAELQRAYWAEIERQRKAAKEIEGRAIQREGEAALISRAMQAKIDEFAAKEKEPVNVPSQPSFSIPAHRASPAPRPCIVDDELARVVRSLDATAHRRR